MPDKTEVQTDSTQGFSKLVGRIVGGVLLLLALVFGAYVFLADGGETTSRSSTPAQQSQPTNPDDDALRRSLGK